MHAPLNLQEMIVMLAMGGDNNPLRDLPENTETIMLKQLEDFQEYWLGTIINYINENNIMRHFSLEDLAEILDDDENPLKPILVQDPCPDNITKEHLEQYVAWYSKKIAAFIEERKT